LNSHIDRHTYRYSIVQEEKKKTQKNQHTEKKR
jgi:hypothetical protein